VTDAQSPRAGACPQTRGEALARGAHLLTASGVDAEEAAQDARALLFAAAGLTRADLVLAPDAPLSADAARRFEAFARRRAAREPVSRIIGTRGFWTLDLLVAPDVLDPRADTETLVAAALDLVSARRGEALSILDLGSGSGAILCALLAELPRAQGVAVDISLAACAATKANLARCGLSARAVALRGRWGEALNARFDLILSNPPYIRSGEIDGLAPEVRAFDPRLALDGGADGLDCYRDIARAAPGLLKRDGVLALEIGYDQAAQVGAVLRAKGLEPIELRRDCGGRDRVLAARRQA